MDIWIDDPKLVGNGLTYHKRLHILRRADNTCQKTPKHDDVIQHCPSSTPSNSFHDIRRAKRPYVISPHIDAWRGPEPLNVGSASRTQKKRQPKQMYPSCIAHAEVYRLLLSPIIMRCKHME